MPTKKPLILCQKPSLVNEFMRDLRDKSIQQDRLRFRRNIERIGEVVAYEISRNLDYKEAEIETVLGIKKEPGPARTTRYCFRITAGLPFQQGLIQFFDRSDAAFVSAYRKPITETDFTIEVQYLATPNLTGRTLILADPMLATGQSIVLTHKAILKNGKPKRLIIAGMIASQQGLDYVQKHLPEAEIYVADVDDELNDHAYIVPGLGDAGDLSFGEKL